MKTNIRKTLFCTAILAILVLPLMGNTVCASENTYYFDRHNTEVEWATNAGNMVDSDPDTYASTTEDGDTQLLNNNTCTGSESGTITGVFIRAKAYYTGAAREVVLQPVFPGGDGDNHSFYPPLGLPNADWSEWFNITDDTNSHSYWTWRDVDNLVVKVKVGLGMTGYTLYVSKVEIKVEYTE
jgi:hypothetical protein